MIDSAFSMKDSARVHNFVKSQEHPIIWFTLGQNYKLLCTITSLCLVCKAGIKSCKSKDKEKFVSTIELLLWNIKGKL